MSKSWTLAGLKASIYKSTARCCGRTIELGEAEYEQMIVRFGPEAEWNDLADRVVCKTCRRRLRFVLSLRDQEPYDLSQAFRPVV